MWAVAVITRYLNGFRDTYDQQRSLVPAGSDARTIVKIRLKPRFCFAIVVMFKGVRKHSFILVQEDYGRY